MSFERPSASRPAAPGCRPPPVGAARRRRARRRPGGRRPGATAARAGPWRGIYPRRAAAVDGDAADALAGEPASSRARPRASGWPPHAGSRRWVRLSSSTAATRRAARPRRPWSPGTAPVDWLVATSATRTPGAATRRGREGAPRRLDVLVNNAGATFPRRAVTPEGVELTLAVNHLAPFLLTTLLLDRLRATAPARMVNVSSGRPRARAARARRPGDGARLPAVRGLQALQARECLFTVSSRGASRTAA